MKKKKINDQPIKYHHGQQTLMNAQKTKRVAGSVSVFCLGLIVGGFLTGYANPDLLGLLMIVFALSSGVWLTSLKKPNQRVSSTTQVGSLAGTNWKKRLRKWFNG